MKKPLTVFHIDMNMAQFRKDYLLKWLKRLKGFSYNTILWELEDSVAWQTCRHANLPDAFCKEEMSEILSFSEKLGFQNIPLLQTIGHAEYILKHDEYAHLREVSTEISQYCPSNPKTIPFLCDLTMEYLELFPKCEIFHIGADEARHLGKCPECAQKVQNESISALYIDHIQQISDFLASHGTRPAIWGDMILAHPEALDRLSRDIMIFDWNYHQNFNSDTIRMWGRWPDITRDELTKKEIQRFGKHLFPNGQDKPWNPFYCTDYLLDQGFDVLTCSTGSSVGDTIFSPKDSMHLPNVFDFTKKGYSQCVGTVYTSWTVHVHPWETQIAEIQIPSFIQKNPDSTLDDFKSWFVQENFGVESDLFWEAANLLEQYCVLSSTSHHGFGKDCMPIDFYRIQNYPLKELRDANMLEAELERTIRLRDDYAKAEELLIQFKQLTTKGEEFIDCRIQAAKLLITHAEAATLILKHELNMPCEQVDNIIETLLGQKEIIREFYLGQQRPFRANQIADYMFDAIIAELQKTR